MKLRTYSRIGAWTLAFSLQGLGILNLSFPDFLAGFRIPFACCIALAVHLPLLLLRPMKDVRGLIVTVLVSTMAMVFALSLICSGGGEYGFWKLGVFLCMSFVPVLLLHQFYMGRSIAILHFIGALTLFSFVSLFQLAQGIGEYGLDAFRWQLLKEGDVIGLSRGIGIGAVLATGYVFRWPGVWLKSLALGTALLMVGAQLLIDERGPLLACMLSIAYLSLTNARKAHFGRDIRRLFIALSIIIFLCFFIWLLPSLSERFTLNDLNADGRVDIYIKGLEDMTHMNLLFGLGFGKFSYYGGTEGDIRQFVHNIFAEIFLETGIVGLTLFVLYGIAIYRFVFSPRAALESGKVPFLVETKALFIYSVLNAQVSGDIGTNYMVWVTGSLAICAIVASKIDFNQPVGRALMPEAERSFTNIRESHNRFHPRPRR